MDNFNPDVEVFHNLNKVEVDGFSGYWSEIPIPIYIQTNINGFAKYDMSVRLQPKEKYISLRWEN